MVKGYSRAQISLHWAVFFLIVYNLLMGDDMSHLWRSLRQDPAAATTTAVWIHIIVGVLVLVFALWRLALRFTRGAPSAHAGDTGVMAFLGSAAHVALYILMLALPITGLLAWYGGVTALAEPHGEILKLLLWVMIALHVGAALYHQFVLKDNLLARMRKPG